LSSLLLPPEEVLQRIDGELRAFAAYVGLTGSKRDEHAAFVEHVADLCRRRFLGDGKGRGKGNGRVASSMMMSKLKPMAGGTQQSTKSSVMVTDSDMATGTATLMVTATRATSATMAKM
jgi:hypothetical protein